MNDALPVTPQDLESMRLLIQRMGANTSIVDFEEQVLIPSVRTTLRAWKKDGGVVGFAYVDDYNNLWFEAESDSMLDNLAGEMIAWGEKCLLQRNPAEDVELGLDTVCSAGNLHRIGLLQQHGFTMLPVRTLRFSRSLLLPLEVFPLPEGFYLRPARGIAELDDLVTLHQAAFGTDAMTSEQRLAIIHAPGYLPELDLVAVSPNEDLAAFCICGFDDPGRTVGYTDPIGTHPRYQNMGLGKAVVSAGMKKLKNLGARIVELGTSSENIPMQRLAHSLGFTCIAEKIWFTKPVL